MPFPSRLQSGQPFPADDGGLIACYTIATFVTFQRSVGTKLLERSLPTYMFVAYWLKALRALSAFGHLSRTENRCCETSFDCGSGAYNASTAQMAAGHKGALGSTHLPPAWLPGTGYSFRDCEQPVGHGRATTDLEEKIIGGGVYQRFDGTVKTYAREIPSEIVACE